MTPPIVRRPTAKDSMCDRCYRDIPEGEVAGYVEPDLHRIPWAAGTVLCSPCSDHLAYKFGGKGAYGHDCEHTSMQHGADGCNVPGCPCAFQSWDESAYDD